MAAALSFSQMTGPKIGSRLKAEAETNVSLAVEAGGSSSDSFRVLARGELQLGEKSMLHAVTWSYKICK